ncbi:MAG TPA: carboxypeptidase-like regulatory domain-containing protein [Vicinamibacterales bacterium]|nr:carboxypeptidase-like regulatory domain-containing protein [Vicinamibacterales bacterium]
MQLRPNYLRGLSVLAAMVAAVTVASGQGSQGAQTQRPAPQQPARDTPAQETPTSGAGVIAGRVVAADTGRPVKRARVSASANELPGGRGVLTDDNGAFQLVELPAGRYTVSVSKSGFVSLAYGQRRPLQPGTPIQLAEGQEIRSIDVRLPRGSVITGHVYDETGDAMPGVVVRVLRYQYQQGNRRLSTAGTAQTDDLGQYRVWGLMPGDYYVDAQSRINLPFGGPVGRGRGGPAAGAIAGLVGAIAGPNVGNLFTPEDENQKAYAPTYFPGVPSVEEAQAVTVGLGQTASGIDFALQLVRVARISGRVSNPDGSPTTRGNVNLTSDIQVAGRGNQLGQNYGSRLSGDGTFAISNIPPGRYLLRARGNNAEWPQYASLPVTVAGTDISDISVTVAEGATVVGTVSFPSGRTTPPDIGQVRISSVAIDPGLTNSQARIEEDHSFKIVAIPAGAHLFRPNGQLRGWSLKSVVLDGRDITDTPIEVRSGQEITRVAVTFTDAVNEINGRITSDQGSPLTEYTVLAFSTDSTFWRPLSRHIATGRPDQTGNFRIRGLPAGGYYLVAVDPAQQGEWYNPSYLEDHRFGAAQVTLGEGETKTQDFRVRAQ